MRQHTCDRLKFGLCERLVLRPALWRKGQRRSCRLSDKDASEPSETMRTQEFLMERVTSVLFGVEQQPLGLYFDTALCEQPPSLDCCVTLVPSRGEEGINRLSQSGRTKIPRSGGGFVKKQQRAFCTGRITELLQRRLPKSGVSCRLVETVNTCRQRTGPNLAAGCSFHFIIMPKVSANVESRSPVPVCLVKNSGSFASPKRGKTGRTNAGTIAHEAVSEASCPVTLIQISGSP